MEYTRDAGIVFRRDAELPSWCKRGFFEVHTKAGLMMMKSLVMGFFMLASVLALSVSGEDRDTSDLKHTTDSLEKVKELVEKKKAVLVDVRELVEWDAGHIEGAVLLPWRALQEKVDEKKLREKLPEDVIVYTYCAVGYRSLRAGKIIAGYKYDVRPLKPGYDELVKAGFKSEKK